MIQHFKEGTCVCVCVRRGLFILAAGLSVYLMCWQVTTHPTQSHPLSGAVISDRCTDLREPQTTPITYRQISIWGGGTRLEQHAKKLSGFTWSKQWQWHNRWRLPCTDIDRTFDPGAKTENLGKVSARHYDAANWLSSPDGRWKKVNSVPRFASPADNLRAITLPRQRGPTRLKVACEDNG